MNFLKTSLIALLLGVFSLPVFSQENIVKFRPVGVWMQSLSKVDYGYGSYSRTFADYTLGISYERVVADKISAGLDFDFVFTGGTIFVLRPNVNVYLLDSAPHSLYTGGYFDVGFSSWRGGTHIGLGPKVGYQHLFLDNQLAVMGEFGLGFGMFTDAAADGSGPGAGVNLYFTAGVGYAF